MVGGRFEVLVAVRSMRRGEGFQVWAIGAGGLLRLFTVPPLLENLYGEMLKIKQKKRHLQK